MASIYCPGIDKTVFGLCAVSKMLASKPGYFHKLLINLRSLLLAHFHYNTLQLTAVFQCAGTAHLGTTDIPKHKKPEAIRN